MTVSFFEKFDQKNTGNEVDKAVKQLKAEKAAGLNEMILE